MGKEKYIQLPPIPEELDGNVVRMIWEYTKLPEKEQQFVYEQYKVLSDDSRNESDVDAVLIKPDNPENIEEFGKNMKAVIAELFREAVGLAQYVYEECFVNGRDVEEIVVPAYHMNKTHWNSIILDGSVPDKDIQRMIGESYDLTKGKKK